MKRVLIFTTLFLFFVFAGFFLFLKISSQPVSTDTSDIVFVIQKGEGIISVSKNLKSESLIKNQYSFLFYAYYLGLNTKIQSGSFELSPSLSVKEIITKLSQSGVADYWLKIIDGTRVEELTDSFPDNLSFTGADFVKKTKNLQGYIFPDSYLIPEYYTIDQVLEIIQSNFDTKFTAAKIDATNTAMTDDQILILASIIEREARSLKVKQGVAGVLLNRINIDMPLQSDVTIQYIRDNASKPTKYWKDILASDISIVSPYNTYKNTGLPPGPICNPGYDSIYAAFHPTESDYLFYLTGDDGVMYYATTLAEHDANIENHLK